MGTGAVEHYNPRTAATTDITDYTDRPTGEVEFQANRVNGTFIVDLLYPNGAITLRERDEIRVTDGGTRIFGGVIAFLDPRQEGSNIRNRIKCMSYDALLDQRVIPYADSSVRSGSRWDDDEVAWIISFGADLGLNGTTYVSRLRTTQITAEIDYRGLTLRQALDRLGSYTGGVQYWVDEGSGTTKYVHWTDPASAQVVSNGDFENGATNWSLDGAASVNEDGGPGGTGDAALEVTGSGVGRHESTQTVTGITGNRRYMAFADLKSDTADGAAIRLDWQNGSSVSQRIDTIDNDTTTGSWLRVKEVLTAPASAVKVVVMLGVADASTAASSFDNVALVGEDAAFGVSTTPDGTITKDFRDFRRPTDATRPINRLLVIGDGIADWREHAASIGYYGETFEATLRDERVTTSDGIDSRSAYVFRKSAFPVYSGSYKTRHTGLAAGTFQIIEHEPLGILSIDWIATLRVRFEGNGNMLYTVVFGAPEDDLGSVLASVGSAFGDATTDVDTSPPGTDGVAPAVPTGLTPTTGYAQSPDGSSRPYLLATWTANTDADLDAYEVQVDRAIAGEVTIAVSASGTGGSLPAGDYAVQVTGLGSEGGETGVTLDPIVQTVAAGERLYVNITAKAGITTYQIYASILSGDTQPQKTAQTTTTTGSNVEITAAGAGAEYPPAASTAVNFTDPTTARTGAISHYTEDVLGGMYYAVRLRAIDHSGNYSAFTAISGVTIGGDSTAPDIPTNLLLSSGYRVIGARWTRPSDLDIAFYQVRWAPETTPGSGVPDTGLWDRFTTLTNWAIIPDLDSGSLDGVTAPLVYFVQVRSVDRSGNVRTSATDSTAVDHLTNPEAGWSNDGTDEAYVSASAALLSGATDVAYGTITSAHISTIGLDASIITTGTLIVGGTATTPTSFEVQDTAGRQIALWDDTGLLLTDADDANNLIRFMNGALEFSEDGGTTWSTAITAQGVWANAIKLGALGGGHNAVPNSGFELADWATALTNVWTSAADWGSYIGTPVNMDTTGNDLKLTDFTF